MRTYVRTSVCPQKVFFPISVKFGMYAMSGAQWYDPIQDQDHRASKVPKIALFQVYLFAMYNGSRPMTTNS